LESLEKIADWVLVAEDVRTYLQPPDNLDLAGAIERAVRHRRRRDGRPKASFNSVQRYLAALKFIETLEDDVEEGLVPQVARLRCVPVGGVGTISRWATYDWSAAVDAALKYVDGGYTQEELRLAEQNAREQSNRVGSGRSYAYRVRQKLLPWATQLLGDGYERIEDVPQKLPVDFLFSRRGNPELRVGFLVFGPLADEDALAANQGEFVFLAAGLSLALERVIAVVPQSKLEQASYLRCLSDYQATRTNLDFYEFTGLLNDLRLSKIYAESAA
jgi:hypothetical protein